MIGSFYFIPVLMVDISYLGALCYSNGSLFEVSSSWCSSAKKGV